MTFDDLVAVHAKICAYPYVAESIDDWAPITPEGGDCDSYSTGAEEALYHLTKQGWPVTAMRLATCNVEANAGGGYHAVLLVDFEGQTWVIDNRQPHPVEWNLLPYCWDKIQIAGTRKWEMYKSLTGV